MVRRVKKQSKLNSLPILKPNAAGIDIATTEIVVAVPWDRDERPVRSFDAFTQDLYRIAEWLKQCRVDSVAMESTGVYWIPLFQILEEAGLEVYLVNARHAKNVPGRKKTDVCDAQWLQFLHSVGLLTASFRPAQEVCAIRSLLRHKKSLVELAGSHIHHMQKSLDQMNIQLHRVISDITGKTGLAIIDAIIAGQRNLHALAELRHWRIRASKEVIVKALEGDYREEHIFTLSQSLKSFRHYQKMIAACESEIHRLLSAFNSKSARQETADRTVRNFEPDVADSLVHSELKRAFGVDLTQISSIAVETAQIIFAEVGPDFSKFSSASAFASWLTLSPNNQISGGKILRTTTNRNKSRARTALRMAAQSLHHSKSFLGDCYRRMRAKLGAPKAITALAHKIARIIYHCVTTGQEFDETTLTRHHTHYRKRQETKLLATARKLGYSLIPLPTQPTPA